MIIAGAGRKDMKIPVCLRDTPLPLIVGWHEKKRQSGKRIQAADAT